MKTNPASARPHGLASREKQAVAQRARGTYRRQLPAIRRVVTTAALRARGSAAMARPSCRSRP